MTRLGLRQRTSTRGRRHRFLVTPSGSLEPVAADQEFAGAIVSNQSSADRRVSYSVPRRSAGRLVGPTVARVASAFLLAFWLVCQPATSLLGDDATSTPEKPPEPHVTTPAPTSPAPASASSPASSVGLTPSAFEPPPFPTDFSPAPARAAPSEPAPFPSDLQTTGADAQSSPSNPPSPPSPPSSPTPSTPPQASPSMPEPASSFPQPSVLQPSLPQSNAGVDRVGVQFRGRNWGARPRAGPVDRSD